MNLAENEERYNAAVNMVENQKVVIPVLWLQLQLREKAPPPITFKQVQKDLAREAVEMDGKVFPNPAQHDPSLDDIVSCIAQRIKTFSRPDTPKAEAKAIVLANDVLMSCSRTQANGDIYDAVNHLFGMYEEDPFHPNMKNPYLVSFFPDPNHGKVRVSVLKAEGDKLVTIGSCTGVPEFEDDDAAGFFGMDAVEKMKLEGDGLEVIALNRNSWIQDWETQHCMRCGIQFSFLNRRHHCRSCGALVCSNCGRFFLPGAQEVGAGTNDNLRACFLCFQKAVADDLKARKGRCTTPSHGDSLIGDEFSDEEAMGEESPGGVRETGDTSWSESPSRKGSFADSVDTGFDTDEPWPLISVEMGARYQVCRMHAEVKTEWEMVTRITSDVSAGSAGTFLVSPSQNTGNGQGARFQVVVDGAHQVISVEATTGGTGYAPGDALTLPAEQVGASRSDIVLTLKASDLSWSPTKEVLFYLDCRHARIVRWSGLADEGRVVISIVRP